MKVMGPNSFCAGARGRLFIIRCFLQEGVWHVESWGGRVVGQPLGLILLRM